MTDEGFRIDMHVKVLDDVVVERAKRRGLDALVYAPHFERFPTIRARAEAYSDDDLLIVPGREVFTGGWRDRKHVLALGLSDPVPDFITLEGAMAEFDRQDAAVLVPHPEFFTVGLTETDIRAHRDLIDAIEVYNPKHLRRHNDRALELAETFDLPPFASSYAHLRSTVGEAWTRFEEPFATAEALVEAVKNGTRGTPVHRSGVTHRRRRLVEFAHLGYENSWKKLDRVFLSGTEPTHPDHIAYGGQFDDVAVY